jgi:hypothetical protein
MLYGMDEAPGFFLGGHYPTLLLVGDLKLGLSTRYLPKNLDQKIGAWTKKPRPRFNINLLFWQNVPIANSSSYSVVEVRTESIINKT